MVRLLKNVHSVQAAQALTFQSAKLTRDNDATFKTSGGMIARLANVSNTGFKTSKSTMTAVNTTWTTVALFIEIEQDVMMPRDSAEGLMTDL